MSALSLAQLNTLDQPTFVKVCGNFFEHSPWIAERTWRHRPFNSLENLHAQMLATLNAATPEEKLTLIRAHPDLVGKLAAEGKLTRESTAEQAAAGLTALTRHEADLFTRYNAAYRERFGFPFIICARENKKAAILAAFPVRLEHSRDQELQTALAEIAKIARLRILDALSE